jgi:uncharacterized protein YciU (UPF0263 family)
MISELGIYINPKARWIIIMANTHLAAAYDYFLSFLVEKVTPHEILAFQFPEKERQRAIALLEKQDDGTLTPEEVIELEQMQWIDRLVSVLKAKALTALSS